MTLKPITFLATAAVVPLAALAATGCGGGNNATSATPAPKPAHTRPAAVKVANSKLGKILVDSRGRTLYLFTKDTGSKSTCTGACATPWPPLVTHGNPTAASGANASMLGTTLRSGGVRQVNYNGHPLYLFVKDQSPGQTNGEGVSAFGGSWFAVSPAGNRIPATQAAPKQATPAAPKPAPKPAAPKPAPKPAPQAKPKSNGIPQNGGGDGDADNNGGPDDGDGGV